MKQVITFIFALLIISSVNANAIVTSFTAKKVADSVQFNWTVNEDNMFYYEVMEVINVNGSEKMLIHTDATNSTQTTGATYQVSASMTRALMVGFKGILFILLIGSLVCWNKTIRKLALVLTCILLINVSCTKTKTDTTPVNPNVPGKSSSTQGVFRLKCVDLNGNIDYTSYIVLTY